MRVLVLHGTKGSPEGNWFPWLKQELATLGITVDVPQMPTPENQTPMTWYTALADAKLLPNEETIIVGHSLGGNFALRLAEAMPVRGLVLVSPVVADGNLPEYNKLNKPFVEGGFNWQAIRANAKDIRVLVGRDDPYLSMDTICETAVAWLRVNPRIIDGGGHLNAEFGYTTFPEILEIVKEMAHD